MTTLRFAAFSALAMAGAVAFSPAALAKNYLVKNQGEFDKAVSKVKPGDVIVLKSGKWKDANLKFKASGKPGKPITVMAQDAGKTILTGKSMIKMGGEHLVVSGLLFKGGEAPKREVVDFRADGSTPCFNCRFVQNVIMDYNLKSGDQDFWVVMRGQNNKVDHNAFIGKTNNGPTLVVRLDDVTNENNNHLIARNYFGYRPKLGRNGGETIRIGTSKVSMKTSGTKIAQNFFEQANGEIETISVKSRGNKILENTFLETQGSITLRHGGDTLVARNVFIGNGVKATGGVRVINDNQTVRNNYFEGLRGTGLRSAITVMNGIPNSPLNKYVQVSNSVIENNSLFDVREVTFGAGANSERSLPPISTSFKNNVIVTDASDVVQFDADGSGVSFTGNAASFSNAKIGVSASAASPVRGANGLLYVPGTTAGAPQDLKPVTREQTGPKWFKKPAPVSAAKIKAHQKSLKN